MTAPEPCENCGTPVVPAADSVPVKRLQTMVHVSDGRIPMLVGRHDALDRDLWMTARWYEVDLSVELDYKADGYVLRVEFRPHTPDRCRSARIRRQVTR